jgi:vacuolar iron transporter family protein
MKFHNGVGVKVRQPRLVARPPVGQAVRVTGSEPPASNAGPRAVPHDEPHPPLAGRLNWLRAGVLGANDGIVSTAALILGVAGATAQRGPILVAGFAGLLAGAMSMAVGEYVSVSTQRDTERAALAQERQELAEMPEAELEELAGIYREKGLDRELAHQVAEQLSARDALAAHAEAELGIDAEEQSNPWQAAIASFIAFTVGAAIPLLGVVITTRPWLTVLLVTIALLVTGSVSARLGRARVRPAVVRVIIGGWLAMAATYGLGLAFGGLV